MVDLSEDTYFIIGELAELGSVLELVHAHHLHCEDLLGLAVLGPVNVAVLPLAHALHQHVVLHYLVHLLNIILLNSCIFYAWVINLSGLLYGI